MDIFELVEVQDCPLCGGPSLLEEENEGEFYVMCMDCGGRTVIVGPKAGEERLDTAKRAAHIWNIGKAIPSSPGE